LLGIGVIATLVLGLQVAAFALPTYLGLSKFEIDKPDANMTVDGAAGSLDWMNVTDRKTQDLPSGRTDNSYNGGEKEDDICPGAGTGSIPNNKSDLRYFGVHQEAGTAAGDPGYLHLFWTRVSEPSGATLMDFEFNKSKVDCDGAGSSQNRTRSAGDLLIEYKIEGGTDNDPDITIRRWVGSATSGNWGPAQLLDQGDAIGAINISPITAANSDGTLPAGTTAEPRTFGEASIDLDAIFDEDKCESFGSAMLKSRAGPPFDSTMKDFIAPDTGINIQNCGKVIIHKQTTPEGSTQSFSFSKNFATDPVTTDTFSLEDNGTQTYNGVLFANDKTVTETIPSGWTLTSIDCSAGNVTPDSTNTTTGVVQFDIDNAADVLECTYNNSLNQVASTMSSTQSFFPNDSATVSAPSGGNLTGSVKFELFENATCSGTDVKYTQTVPVSGDSPETVSTSNTTVSTTAANVSWRLTYTSTNGLQKSIPATCLEKTALTIDNGQPVSSP
jgi:hypothetical protein